MVNYVRAYWYLYRLKKQAFWLPEKLKKHQNKTLRSIVRYAYANVPFYHQKFKSLGLKPEDIKSVEDLNKLPVIRRMELQQNADEIVSKEFNKSKLLVVSTSGSTGRPLRTYITTGEDEFRKAKHLRANIALGQKPRDRWIVITGPQHFSESTSLQKLLGLYVPLPVSVFDDTATQFSHVEKLKPDILDGYASSLLLLAKDAEKRGQHAVKPRFIISGAEVIDTPSRRYIEEMFSSPLFDQYATAEFERLAWQCEEKGDYHIDADTVIMQFVDENGEDVAPGERGEIVCTSLFNYAMPFIRYAVGDIGVAADSDETCECGRTLPLLKAIEGRKDSLIVLPGGRVLTPLALGWAMEFFKYYFDIDQYRVVQKRVDLLKFLVKVRDSCVIDKTVVASELVGHLRKTLDIGSEVAFDVEFVDAISLDKSGKLRKVISEISGA